MNMYALKHNPIVDSLRLLIDLARIRSHRKYPLAIVLSMPKTGGTTVNHALSSNSRNLVFHIHTLDRQSIRDQYNVFRKHRGGAPYHLSQSKLLLREFDNNAQRWKIISLVREPIGRDLSLFFQTGKEFHDKYLDEVKNYKMDLVNKYLTERIVGMAHRNQSRETEWLDRELYRVLGVDVYNHNFDHDAGFINISSERADLLMIRLEDVGRCFNSAISDFLELHEPIKLLDKNVAVKKSYASDYNQCLKQVRIPKDILKRIYAEKYCQHFYTPEMIDRFISKWAND